jgi:hypothetical protein
MFSSPTENSFTCAFSMGSCLSLEAGQESLSQCDLSPGPHINTHHKTGSVDPSWAARRQVRMKVSKKADDRGGRVKVDKDKSLSRA